MTPAIAEKFPHIRSVLSVPGAVSFDLVTDASGCDEDFSFTVDDGTKKRFATHITFAGKGILTDQLIKHNLAGDFVVKVVGETSGAFSDATPLTLTA
jgi:hypothetical protein